MKKFYYFLVFGISLSQVCAGQLNYTFSASSGTYTAISGTVAPLTLGATSPVEVSRSPQLGFAQGIEPRSELGQNKMNSILIDIHMMDFLEIVL